MRTSTCQYKRTIYCQSQKKWKIKNTLNNFILLKLEAKYFIMAVGDRQTPENLETSLVKVVEMEVCRYNHTFFNLIIVYLSQ